MIKINDEKYYTVAEVVKESKLSRGFIHNRINDNTLSVIKLNRVYYITKASYELLLSNCKIDKEGYYTVEEIVKKYKVSASKVSHLMVAGKLDCVKMLKKCYLLCSEVDAYFEKEAQQIIKKPNVITLNSNDSILLNYDNKCIKVSINKNGAFVINHNYKS